LKYSISQKIEQSKDIYIALYTEKELCY